MKVKTSADHRVARQSTQLRIAWHDAEIFRRAFRCANDLGKARLERFPFLHARPKAFHSTSCGAQPDRLQPTAQNTITKIVLAIVVVIVFAPPLATYAQPRQLQSVPAPHSKEHRAPQSVRHRASRITRWVPASTHLFIRLRRLDKVDASLQRTYAWQLLPLIAGQPIKAFDSFFIRNALVSFLGIASSTNTDALAKCEFGIVANSWLELPHAVWIVKLPRSTMLNEWFPKSTRVGDRQIGPAEIFRTRSGLSVCARGQFAALARRGANQHTLQQIRTLMVAQASAIKPLSLSQAYRELMTYLPGQDIAHAYFSLSGAETKPTGPQTPATLALTRLSGTALVGMFDRDGHIDFTFRLSQTSPTQTTTLADDTLEQMAKLPQTTIAAIATTFDFADHYDRTMDGPPNSAARRYMRLLQGLGRGNVDHMKLIKSLGPDMLVVWDSGTKQDEQKLHLAVMVKCSDARRIRAEFTYLVANLLRLLQIFDPLHSSNKPSLELDRHLGLSYVFVDWQAYSENAKLPIVSQLTHTCPAWAAWGDWFIFALDRDHLDRIVDARYGMRESMGMLAEVNPLSLQKKHATTAAWMRTGLAAQYIQTWLDATNTSKTSLLAASWWMKNQPVQAKRLNYIGFGLVAQNEAVVVVSVDAQGLAAGLLQKGDRIRGVDGSLLSLEDPVGDLTKKLTSKANEPHWLRVRRDGQWMEVKLPSRQAEQESGHDNPIEAAIVALREFAQLGRTIQETFVAIHAPSDHTTAARLTVKLKPIAEDTETSASLTTVKSD